MPGSVSGGDAGGVMNKACDACYKSKLKCVGREKPPCKRCQTQGIECSFDGRRKSRMTQVEDRITSLESTLGGVQSQLDQILSLQLGTSSRAVIPSPTSIGHSTGATSNDQTPLNASSQSSRLPPSYPTKPLGSSRSFYNTQSSTSFNSIQPSYLHGHDSASTLNHLDEDPLLDVVKRAPLGRLIPLAEAARARADAMDRNSGYRGTKRSRSGEVGIGVGVGIGNDKTEERPEDPSGANYFSGNDPVNRGIVDETTGKRMLDSYYSKCHSSLPIFDPGRDTWDSLRLNSPFALTTVLFVGARVEDGGSPSAQQQLLLKHSEDMARDTLFSTTAEGDPSAIYAIQGLVVLSAWGDTGWRPGGHATRIAIERNLHRALLQLIQKMDTEPFRTTEQVEDDISLVIASRVWLAICKMEYEMAFNQGRVLLIRGEPCIPVARRLLEHPLSLPTDSRIVAACELMRGRNAQHVTFEGPTTPSFEEIVKEVEGENTFFEKWHNEWDSYYVSRGVPEGDYLREILLTFKCHSIVACNSRLLGGLHSAYQVSELDQVRRNALERAVRASAVVVHVVASGQGYKANFLGANGLAHVGMVLAARLLIRLAGLLPEAVDLRQVGRDLEELTHLLRDVPRRQLAEHVQQVLEKARKSELLPPRSRLPSPEPTKPATSNHFLSVGGGNMGNQGLQNGMFGQPMTDLQIMEQVFPSLNDINMNQYTSDTGTGNQSGISSTSWQQTPGGNENQMSPLDLFGVLPDWLNVGESSTPASTQTFPFVPRS